MSVVRRANRVLLRTIANEDIPFLYELATAEETGFTWRLRGVCPPVDVFAAQLWNNVAAQFIVVEAKSSAPLGHVVAYNYDPRDGYCYVGCVFTQSSWRTTLTVGGLLLFLTYLFDVHPLRKVYAELPAFNFSHFAAGQGKYFQTEGRLRRHVFQRGEYWDQLIIAMEKDAFLSATRGLRRIFGIECSS